MRPTTKRRTPRVAAPEARALTTKARQTVATPEAKASPWHFPAEGRAARAAYLRACAVVFTAALAEGPTSLSAAREAVSLYPPPGVDARCAAHVIRAMVKAGTIVWVRWGRSPLRTHHHGASGVWMLAGGAS